MMCAERGGESCDRALLRPSTKKSSERHSGNGGMSVQESASRGRLHMQARTPPRTRAARAVRHLGQTPADSVADQLKSTWQYNNGARSGSGRGTWISIRRITIGSSSCLAETTRSRSDFTASPRLSLSFPPRLVTPSHVDDGEANSRVQGARSHFLWRPGLWSRRSVPPSPPSSAIVHAPPAAS